MRGGLCFGAHAITSKTQKKRGNTSEHYNLMYIDSLLVSNVNCMVKAVRRWFLEIRGIHNGRADDVHAYE